MQVAKSGRDSTQGGPRAPEIQHHDFPRKSPAHMLSSEVVNEKSGAYFSRARRGVSQPSITGQVNIRSDCVEVEYCFISQRLLRRIQLQQHYAEVVVKVRGAFPRQPCRKTGLCRWSFFWSLRSRCLQSETFVVVCLQDELSSLAAVRDACRCFDYIFVGFESEICL